MDDVYLDRDLQVRTICIGCGSPFAADPGGRCRSCEKSYRAYLYGSNVIDDDYKFKVVEWRRSHRPQELATIWGFW